MSTKKTTAEKKPVMQAEDASSISTAQAAEALLRDQRERAAAAAQEIEAVCHKYRCRLAAVVTLRGGTVPEAQVEIVSLP